MPNKSCKMYNNSSNKNNYTYKNCYTYLYNYK